MPDDARLRDLDEQIAQLREENDGLRSQVGGDGVGAQDSEDVAAALTNMEENDAILASLEQRRERLVGDDADGSAD